MMRLFMETCEEFFLPVSDLAELAEVYPDMIKRLLYDGVIKKDGLLKRGRDFVPIFSSLKTAENLAAIAQHKERRLSVAA